MNAEKPKHTLPTLAELHETNLQVAYKQDRLLLLLSSPVNKAWIKKHPTISVKNDKNQYVKLEYIAVDKLEFLLNKIYGFWYVEILREGQLFNSCFVVVRLHVLNPVTEEWEYRDGIGAQGMQTDAGATAGNLGAIKNDAVMKGLPSAASYAFKNACKKLGAIFGGDLNNYEVEEYEPTYGQPVVDTPAPLVPVTQQMIHDANTTIDQPESQQQEFTGQIQF